MAALQRDLRSSNATPPSYDLGDLAQGRTVLADKLQEWAAQASRQPAGVKVLEDRRPTP